MEGWQGMIVPFVAISQEQTTWPLELHGILHEVLMLTA